LNETPGTTSSSGPSGPDDDPRPEVVDLCNYLADWIERNGSKRPSVGKRWLQACRLLIDTDGRTPEQVRRAIDWCQHDGFWKSNILSMPKLREKYDQLRLRAEQEREGRRSTRQQETDDQFARMFAMAAEIDARNEALRDDRDRLRVIES